MLKTQTTDKNYASAECMHEHLAQKLENKNYFKDFGVPVEKKNYTFLPQIFKL